MCGHNYQHSRGRGQNRCRVKERERGGKGATKSKRSALMASAEQMKNEKLATCDIFFTFSRYIFLLLFDTFWGRAQAATHNYAKLKGMLKCPDDPENRKFISKQTHTHTLAQASLLCASTCEQCDSNKKQLKVPRVLSCRPANVIHTATTHTHTHSYSLAQTDTHTRTHIYIHVYCVAATPTSTRLIHILFRHCCCCCLWLASTARVIVASPARTWI